MRNKIRDLIWGLFAMIICITSLFKGESMTNILGFEINSWIYRSIWFFIAITNLCQYFIRLKTSSEKIKLD
ncbi:hypothetical protein [Polaribacter porphyrae]|uniref:hypothetical protein n=1 Tax=Polaribacter porphyrae TaxID=1137780 RepID=UPI0011B0DD64|nr:hypothetical protein [Polaribacter porphyrae]